jgi:hypothetical protein
MWRRVGVPLSGNSDTHGLRSLTRFGLERPLLAILAAERQHYGCELCIGPKKGARRNLGAHAFDTGPAPSLAGSLGSAAGGSWVLAGLPGFPCNVLESFDRLDSFHQLRVRAVFRADRSPELEVSLLEVTLCEHLLRALGV